MIMGRASGWRWDVGDDDAQFGARGGVISFLRALNWKGYERTNKAN